MIAPDILIAEDEASLRNLMAETLEDAGFHVAQAADGEEALAQLKAHPGIRLLLSDIRMPRVDGYALVEKCLSLVPEIKILMMTGYAQAPPFALLCAREIRTLHKPIDMDRLCDLAGQMLARP